MSSDRYDFAVEMAIGVGRLPRLTMGLGAIGTAREAAAKVARHRMVFIFEVDGKSRDENIELLAFGRERLDRLLYALTFSALGHCMQLILEICNL